MSINEEAMIVELCHQDSLSALDALREILISKQNQITQLQEQLEREQWVSVKDKMPTPYEYVIVFDGEFSNNFDVDFFNDEMEWDSIGSGVTHWKLITPPKQEV